ncbi:MAG: TIGR03668 family PPOX class F420-dependent oxidoreductase [Thaumarchaeota archaeon]|nr:TIGR03668 family PPOX class F420-dependent oxidoreductase [Nitrososphaerota archaeon]
MNRREEEYLRLKERGFLATLGKDGNPTVVPICFVYWNGAIYTAVDEKPKSRKLARLRNIEGDGRVAFIVDNYSQNWKKLSYLLVHGRARIVGDLKEAETAKGLLVEKYPQYRRLKLKEPVIAVSIERTKLWEFDR